MWYERSFDGGLCAGWGNYCDIRKSGLCEIAQDVFEKYYLMLADISPVICNNYGYYLRTEKGDSYGGLLRYVEAARRGDPQAAYNAGISTKPVKKWMRISILHINSMKWLPNADIPQDNLR